MPVHIDDIPHSSGVYIFRDSNGRVLYVGKAVDLKRRVSSYFSSRDLPERIRKLVENISTVDVVLTSNEREALVLEANLIKEFSPPFNIQFKDDKFYPFIKVSLNEDYPAIYRVRRVENDSAFYLGPFTRASYTVPVIKLVQRFFGIRTCRTMPKKVCLLYHTGRCLGPCEGKVSQEEYLKAVDRAVRFLKGEWESVIGELKSEMSQASEDLNFEKAKVLRDQIRALESLKERQFVFSPNVEGVEEFVGYHFESGKLGVSVILSFQGVVKGKFNYVADEVESVEDALRQFLIGRYIVKNFWRKVDRVVVDFDVRFAGEFDNLEVEFTRPETEREKAVIKLAVENAKLLILRTRKEHLREGLLGLKNLLGLREIPRIVDGFDIATLEGRYSVGASVRFKEGRPLKSGYRRFKIRWTAGKPDDFAMMEETVFRRYRLALEKGEELPDVILIDGGPYQLKSALNALRNFNFDVRVLSLAKRYEEIYLSPDSEPLRLPSNSSVLNFLQTVRDEAHRFVNAYHRNLRSKGEMSSLLKEIEGVGDKTISKIRKHYHSLQDVVDRGVNELRAIGIPEKTAEKIVEFLRRKLQSG